MKCVSPDIYMAGIWWSRILQYCIYNFTILFNEIRQDVYRCNNDTSIIRNWALNCVVNEDDNELI